MATIANLYSVIQGLAPLLHYPLTETSGTALVNAGSLGTACNLTLTGSYTLANRPLITGDSTSFLKLTGGYATGSRGALPLPLTNATFSVVLEVFPSTPLALPTTLFLISANGETAATNAQALFQLNASTFVPLSFHENGLGDNNQVTATQTIALKAATGVGNSTVHFTVVRDATAKQIRFYYNGGLLFFGDYPENPTGGTSTSMYFGSEPDARPSHPMALGHMCMWNRVLSDTELFDLHTASGYYDQPGEGSLDFGPLAADLANWGTLESTQSLLAFDAFKRLSISLNPLVERSVLEPENEYVVY